MLSGLSICPCRSRFPTESAGSNFCVSDLALTGPQLGKVGSATVRPPVFFCERNGIFPCMG